MWACQQKSVCSGVQGGPHAVLKTVHVPTQIIGNTNAKPQKLMPEAKACGFVVFCVGPVMATRDNSASYALASP